MTTLAASLALLAPGRAEAGAITVTRFDDPVPGACDIGDCSLREAIMAANAAPGANTISLGVGTYQLSVVGTNEDAALDGDLDIVDDLTITGQGSGKTVIDANGSVTGERAFEIDPISGGAGPTAAFSDLTITGGAGGSGAGLRPSNESRVSLDRVAVTGNATGSFGGAMYNTDDAVVTITRSTISGNSSTSRGSAIYNNNTPHLTIRNSVISGNMGLGAGETGALHNQNEATMIIENSLLTGNTTLGHGGAFLLKNDSITSLINTTVSGNGAAGYGGGIFIRDGADATVSSSTITANAADSDADAIGSGGGVHVDPGHTGTISFHNSILAGNSDPTSEPDCFGVVGSAGYNLIGDTTGCAFTPSTGDRTGTAAAPLDPRLGPLRDNGGPTLTHALRSSSPAINQANPAAPGSGGTACPGDDQRGAPRKDCDIGAYELVRCAGTVVNRVGTAGKDSLKGTNRRDGMIGLGGKDTLIGKRGKDALCGGPGKDKLKGGGGKDRLNGQGGKDLCIGGPGADRARKCEREKRI